MPVLKIFAGDEQRLVLEPADDVPELPGLTEVRTAAFETELGFMAAQWQGGKLARLSFGHGSAEQALDAIGRLDFNGPRLAHAHRALVERLRDYAGGAPDNFADVPVALDGLSPFAERVVTLCRGIGYGSALTYGQLAARAGSPGAARAVGNVMATNRVPLVVPCHRVVASGGSLGGFSAPNGIGMKRRLLELEGYFSSSVRCK